MLSAVPPSASHASFQLARALSPFAMMGFLCTGRTLTSSSSVTAAMLAQSSQHESFAAPWDTDVQHLAADQYAQPRFPTALCQFRSQFPASVWSKLASLFSEHRRQPLAVDVAVGCEGLAGPELARRGFKVVSIGGDASLLNAAAPAAPALPKSAQVAVVAPQEERDALQTNSADLVTCMHNLHLLDRQRALQESHRLLRPGGKLCVAFNTRDLDHYFVDLLEEATEMHAPSYSRQHAQQAPAAWARALKAAGHFKLVHYSAHPNRMVLEGSEALAEVMAATSYPQGTLTGAALEAYLEDIRALGEACFGKGPLLLPAQTRLFVLEALAPRCRQ